MTPKRKGTDLFSVLVVRSRSAPTTVEYSLSGSLLDFQNEPL